MEAVAFYFLVFLFDVKIVIKRKTSDICIDETVPYKLFIDIYTVAIENIKNLYAISTSQIVDILHFNDNNL